MRRWQACHLQAGPSQAPSLPPTGPRRPLPGEPAALVPTPGSARRSPVRRRRPPLTPTSFCSRPLGARGCQDRPPSARAAGSQPATLVLEARVPAAEAWKVLLELRVSTQASRQSVCGISYWRQVTDEETEAQRAKPLAWTTRDESRQARGRHGNASSQHRLTRCHPLSPPGRWPSECATLAPGLF